jgi:hypothetical protein
VGVRMTRDTLFISHATPEDNEFSIWLASRLEMLGYKIWLDKEKLLGGETFWLTIQNVIKNDTAKFLLVYSENICDKNGNLKEGIYKELSYAESIAKDEKIEDFIIPLHITKDSSFNKFIGSNILVHIPFSNNWAEGLNQLKEKLVQSSIPIETKQYNSTFANWYEDKYNSDCVITEKKEQLYSSWWEISEFPECIYIFIFHNTTIAEKIKEKNNLFPIGIISNILTSFNNNLDFFLQYEFGEYNNKPNKIKSYSVNDIIKGFESDSFPYYRDVKNHFMNLLNLIINKIFSNRGLISYELSNRIAYFMPKKESFTKVKFILPNTEINKKKNIGGQYLDIGFWHYGISVKPLLFPFFGYSIKSHIIFTSDGKNVIADTKKQHSYRRKKCRRFFNDEWRSLQLAFIQNLKDLQGNIQLTVGEENIIVKMEEWPILFQSNFGYIDPQSINDDIDDGIDEQFETEINKISDNFNE